MRKKIEIKEVKLFLLLIIVNFFILFAGVQCLAGGSLKQHIPKVDGQERGKSKLVYPGKDGKLIYKSFSENGDVIPDFSWCGYKGGGIKPPVVPVALTLKPLDGEKDDSLRIQAAIDEVAKKQPDQNGFRGAVLLKAGIYYIDKSINLHSNGVVLRGEGQSVGWGTLVVSRVTSRRSPAVAIKGKERSSSDSQNQIPITDDIVRIGSREFTVLDASSFKHGDFIVVNRPSSDDWLREIGMKSIPDRHPVSQWKGYSFGYVRSILRIDGNKITIDAPMVMSLLKKYGGGTISKYNFKGVKNVGVENIRFVSKYDPSILDISGLEVDENHTKTAISISNARDVFVSNVTAQYFVTNCVSIGGGASRVTVADCSYIDPVSEIRGGRRYSFSIGGSASEVLVIRCYSRDARHDFSLGSRCLGPNAFVDCVGERSKNASEPHHRFCQGGLWDNVILKDGGSFLAVNRGDSGSGHGWSGTQMVFWNCRGRQITVMKPPKLQNFAIGYNGYGDTTFLQWKSSIDPKSNVSPWLTLRSFQEFDNQRWPFAGDGHIEVTNMLAEPRSLYLRQLKDRLGLEAVKQVAEAWEIRELMPKDSASIKKKTLEAAAESAKRIINKYPLLPAKSKLVQYDSTGKLKYKSYNENGDIIPDFSAVGFRDSSVPIPNVKVALTIAPQQGGKDDSPRIQKALDELALKSLDENGLRGSLLLKAGTYRIEETLYISASGVVLCGETVDGINKTILLGTKKAKYDILVIGSKTPEKYTSSPVMIEDKYVSVGSKYLTLADASSFKVGDDIVVHRPSTQEWIDSLRINEFEGRNRSKEALSLWTPGTVDLQFERSIEAIKGNEITLDSPMVHSLDSRYTKAFVTKGVRLERLRNIGVENINIVSLYDKSKYIKIWEQYYDEDHAWNAIKLLNVRDGWVRNVHGQHLGGSLVFITKDSRNITVRDSVSRDHISPQEHRNRRSFFVEGERNLIINCKAFGGRNAFSLGDLAAGPNVFSNCSTKDCWRWVGTIGRYAVGALFEQIEVITEKDGGGIAAISIYNKCNAAETTFWSGANIVFWNTASDSAVAVVNPPGSMNFAIGNVGGQDYNNIYHSKILEDYVGWVRRGLPDSDKVSSFRDPRFSMNLNLPDNFPPLIGTGYIELPQNSVDIDKLFDAQLSERIGAEQTLRVLGK